MLNGSTVQATDKGLHSSDTLDHSDQIKVFISSRKNTYSTQNAYLKGIEMIKGKYDKDKSELYGLQCRWRSELSLVCFGKPDDGEVSGVVFSFWDSGKVRAVSYEPLYGGIQVEWYINKSQLKHWRQVNSAIWYLLDSWNVSPIKANQ